MNKKTFLGNLRKRLNVLSKDEVDDILEEYEGYINEKVSSGKSEEDAIKDFGNFDSLVKEILSAYKLNENYEDSVKEKNLFSEFIDNSVSFLKDIVRNIGSRSKSDIIKFVFEFIALLLFIAILKIPVIIIEDAGRWLFERLISPFGDGLGIIWKYAIEIIYLLISVASIVSFVKKKYICDDINENKKVSVKCKNSKRIEKCKTDNTSSNSFSNVLIVLFKVCLILFVVVPAIFSFLVAFVLVIIGIVLLIDKVPYLGIFLCMLTYLILNFLFLDLSFKFIFNKKLNSKSLIITIISTVVLFAVGIGLSFYEVVNTTFIDAVPKDIKQLSKEKEELYSDNLSLTCKNIYHTNCEYVIDDTLEDKVVATVTYYDYNNEADDNLNVSRTKNADKLKVKNVYKLILSGLRKREFYNFDNINNVILTIKLSTDTKNKIDEKERNESCFGYENCTCDNEGVCSGYNDED